MFVMMLCLLQGLKNMVLYVLLAPFSNEQSDMLHRVKGEKKLEQIPKYRYVCVPYFFNQKLRRQFGGGVNSTEIGNACID